MKVKTDLCTTAAQNDVLMVEPKGIKKKLLTLWLRSDNKQCHAL